MKKIIFGSASAILAVIGFSSFKNTKAFATSYYWFKTTETLPVSTTNPTLAALGGTGTFIAFEQQPLEPCDGSVDLCIVGYTLGSIHGFNGSGIPTSFKTLGGSETGTPKPWKTRGGVAQGN